MIKLFYNGDGRPTDDPRSVSWLVNNALFEVIRVINDIGFKLPLENIEKQKIQNIILNEHMDIIKMCPFRKSYSIGNIKSD